MRLQRPKARPDLMTGMRSLRLRLLVGIVLSVLALLGILYLPLRSILLQAFSALEREDVARTAEQLALLVRVQQDELARIVRDYAWWDDTYDYMAERNPDYLDNYALDTLLNNGMDVVILFDTAGHVAYGVRVTPDRQGVLPLEAESVEALTVACKGAWGQDVPSAITNVALVEGARYVLVAATPILNTYQNRPARGVMLIGRYVDDKMLRHFSSLLGYTVALATPPSRGDDVAYQVMDGGSLAAMLVVRAADGAPMFALSWTHSREVYQRGVQTLTLAGAAIAAGGLFVGGLLLIMLELVLLQRLKTMANDAEVIATAAREQNFTPRLTVAGADELGLFGARINAMLDTLETTQQQLKEQKFLLENLVQVARTVVEGLDLEVTLRNALEIALSLSGARQGSLMLVDEFLHVQRNLIVRDKIFLEESEALCQVFMDRGLAGWVARHGLPACVEDITLDARWVVRGDAGAPAQSGSALSVPIIGAGRVLGVLTLTHPERGHFTAAHTLMLQAAVEQIALAIRNASLYEEQRHLTMRQTVLYEVLRAISGLQDQEAVLQTALNTLLRMTPWKHISIFLPDESLQVLRRQSSTHNNLPLTMPITEGIVGRAFRERQTQYVPDVLHDPDYRALTPTTRSQLSVPLRRGERVLGVFSLESEVLDGFTREDRVMAESLAETLALALDGVHSHMEIRHYLANLNVMFALARMVNQSMDLKELLSQALATLVNSLGFECGAVFLCRPGESGAFTLEVEQALPADIRQAWKQGADAGWWQFLLERQQPLVIGDLERSDLPFINRLKSSWSVALGRLSRAQLRCIAMTSLTHQQHPEGVLVLMARQARIFSAEDVSLLNLIGQQIAAAVSHARLFEAIADERSRLEALIRAEQDGVLFITTDGRIGLANPAALQWLQDVTEEEKSIRIDNFMVMAERLAPELADLLHRVPRQQNGSGELRLGWRTIAWTLQPVAGESDTLLGWLVVLRDITETRRLEAIRDDMTHALVHDLRNPLTAMAGAMKLLGRQLTNAPEQVQQLLTIAQGSLDRMVNLITSILDIARMEEGRMPLHLQPIKLDEFLQQEMAMLQIVAERKAITLALTCEEPLPLVKADADLLRRVVENLVGNALKFTSEEGRVEVTARYDDKLERVLVQVRDSGNGIPESLRGRLFQKFASGDQVGRGSGLGLAFCRMVLEAHGELIWLEDTGPTGTTFAFTLAPWTEEEGA